MRLLDIAYGEREPYAGRNQGKKGKMMKSEPGFPVLGQAVPAIDRPSFRGLERDFAFLSTV